MEATSGAGAGTGVSSDEITVSAVIPTRNRRASLDRTLRALAGQTRPADEVLVVDASDRPIGQSELRVEHPDVPLAVLHAEPGVCGQRNLGIARAAGSHVLLLDDDIETPSDYLERLVDALRAAPSEGAVTGLVCEPDRSGHFVTELEIPSLRHLAFAFVFQLTVWGDVQAAAQRTGGWSLPTRLLAEWYRRRGNRWSLAGWPLVTTVRGPSFRTATYGLGAALIRRSWLTRSPFDERLGPHGIGDNYGVALGFPRELGILVLRDVPAFHHREPANRLEAAESYYRRLLALDYFLRRRPPFRRSHRVFLAWSLVGNVLRFAVRADGARLGRTIRALGLVISGRNPLLFPEGRRASEAVAR